MTATTLRNLVQAAGVVQLLIASANFVLPAKLRYRENLARVTPIIRQIFIVHAVYIVLVLIGFAGLCLFFTDELSGASTLGRVISGFLAFFWLLRITIQIFYYDDRIKRRYWLADTLFMVLFLYLAIVFAAAAVLGK